MSFAHRFPWLFTARWAATIGLAFAVVLVLAACSAAPGSAAVEATAGATGDGPVVAFYGDSYTRGTGASDPSQRWSTRIANDRGWVEFNTSIDGLGFVNNRDRLGVDLPDEIIDADPDIVIVTMGLNDVFSYDRAGDAIHAQIQRDFDRLTVALPDARFVVVEPFWYTAVRPEALEVIIGWVREAAEAVDADYISGASYWIQGREGEMASDGLHPNDEGYDLIARRMDAALSELGL